MARNQPFDFSDDDDLAIASSGANLNDAELSGSGTTGLPGMGDELMDEAGTSAGPQTDKTTQQTATRSTTGQHDNPTSMRNKRGNQPR